VAPADISHDGVPFPVPHAPSIGQRTWLGLFSGLPPAWRGFVGRQLARSGRCLASYGRSSRIYRGALPPVTSRSIRRVRPAKV